MFTATKAQWSVHGIQKDFLCTSVEDIAKLPKKGVEGTQTVLYDDKDTDQSDNEPCIAGSTAILLNADGSSSLYLLWPDNEWREYL